MNCQSLLSDRQRGPHVPKWAPGTPELILGVSLCGRVSQEEAAELCVRTDPRPHGNHSRFSSHRTPVRNSSLDVFPQGGAVLALLALHHVAGTWPGPRSHTGEAKCWHLRMRPVPHSPWKGPPGCWLGRSASSAPF